jgi:transposase
VHVVALGITTEGVKVPLGLWEGSTENATLARSLLADLVDRGLDAGQAILFVLDGGKALRRAIKDVFGEHALVHRCHRHKECHEGGVVRSRGQPRETCSASERRDVMQQFVGIDWATRRARWCAVTPAGAVIDEDWAAADEGGLAMLVARLGPEALACIEMMSGAAWVRERLQAGGWTVQIADARKAKAVGSLAAKTDKLDARVLAELARRDLVPQVHVPTFSDRELKERLGRRMHMVRLRTSAMNRAHGVMSQFGVTLAFKRLRRPDREELLIELGVPQVWRRSIAEAVGIVRELDERLIPIEQELRPLARADARVALLVTIPGIGELLGLTIASEIGDISRFPTARKLVGYSGLTPRVYQSGQKSRTGKLSKSGSTMLRWAAIEAAQQAWRPSNPWHQLYRDVKERCGGKGNPAKAAVARKVLIASWHVLALQQPFSPSRPRGAAAPVLANSSCVLAD